MEILIQADSISSTLKKKKKKIAFIPVSFIPRVTPIFTVSCVDGENLDLVKKFLNLVPPLRSPTDQEKLAQDPTEYQV